MNLPFKRDAADQIFKVRSQYGTKITLSWQS